MRTGRPKAPLVLTKPERHALEGLARRARTAPQVARRARIVLACAGGLDNQTVAKKVRVSAQMVGRWRARFVVRRADGLFDEPRPGVPRTIAPSPMRRSTRWSRGRSRRPRAARHSGARARWPAPVA